MNNQIKKSLKDYADLFGVEAVKLKLNYYMINNLIYNKNTYIFFDEEHLNQLANKYFRVLPENVNLDSMEEN